MKMISHDTIFTNVAMTPDGDIWWEGIDTPPPDHLIDWRGNPWRKDSGDKAAHPNSRFTTPMTNNPALSPNVNDAQGVPISAIVFGGRRATTMPLVLESGNWEHGVYMGATMGSETTAAAVGAVGVVRRDPMAMLPFCGYNMGDYFSHWLSMQSSIRKRPGIFMVNWFRRGPNGQFLWPGYGENLRALKWMLDRIDGRAGAIDTPVGKVPRPEDLDLRGLDTPVDQIREDLSVKKDEWSAELASAGEFFDKLGHRMPQGLREKHRALTASLNGAH
jgi:phosphoenolpyruvate carboxykinase (GTP)